MLANGIIDTLYNFVPSALSPLLSSKSKTFPCYFLPWLLMRLGRNKIILTRDGLCGAQAERLGEFFCQDGLFLRAAIAGSVVPQCCVPKERVSGKLPRF